MNKPQTFGHLIRRLTPRESAPIQNQGPVIASATPLSGGTANDSPSWVILHSITDSDLRLIHPRPLGGRELAVEISASSGEFLRVILTMEASEQKGELYETTAQFLL